MAVISNNCDNSIIISRRFGPPSARWLQSQARAWRGVLFWHVTGRALLELRSFPEARIGLTCSCCDKHTYAKRYNVEPALIKKRCKDPGDVYAKHV